MRDFDILDRPAGEISNQDYPEMSTGPTYAEIAEMLRDRVEDFAEHVIGERPSQRSRNEIRFYKDGKIRVKLAGPKRGRFTNFADGRFGDMVDLYMWKTGASRRDAIEYAKSWLGISDAKPMPAIPRRDPKDLEAEQAADEARRLRAAAWLWRSSSRTIDPMIPAYLASRKIEVKLPACIRSREIVLDAATIEKLGIDKEELEALGDTKRLVAAVFGATDRTGTVRAVQQIILKDGRKAPLKAPKRTNGLMPGAAVRLAKPTDTLILAEGPETGLSIWGATGIPTWIVLGSANFCLVEIPETVKTLILAVDLEEKGYGLGAALKAACFWQTKGLTVKLALPGREGDSCDFNDVLKTEGAESLKARIDAAITSVDPVRVATEAALIRNPFDALALWQATGITVIPTMRPINPELHAPEAFKTVRIVLEPGEELPELGTLAKRETIDLRVVRPTVPVRALLASSGAEAVARLYATATAYDKEPLYGLERLVENGTAPVFLNVTRAAADAAAAAGLVALAYNPKEAERFDWTALKGRTVVIAPVHLPVGVAYAAQATALARAAGATDVRTLSWPLFAPIDNGHYAVRHEILPRGYDFTQAVKDGWTGAHAPALASLAQPV